MGVVSINGLTRATGVSFDKIRTLLLKASARCVDGYVFRPKSSEPWEVDFTKQQNRAARKFRMTNEKTGEELLFESRGKAVAFLEVDKTTFFSYLEKNIPLKNWRIEEIQEHSPLGAKSSSVLL